jgi:hypothetical protein
MQNAQAYLQEKGFSRFAIARQMPLTSGCKLIKGLRVQSSASFQTAGSFHDRQNPQIRPRRRGHSRRRLTAVLAATSCTNIKKVIRAARWLSA